MQFIYNISINIIILALQPFRLFSKKLNIFFKDRVSSLDSIEEKIKPNDKSIWFHVASLGEFEQIKPIVETLKSENDNLKILISFFSPSGFKSSLNYNIAERVYLPLDTKKNAKNFINKINPNVAVFVKNDIWTNYLIELKKKEIPIYSISSKFYKSQFYFQSYGKWFLNKLKQIDYFFVQDKSSKELLNLNHINNVSITGDTRIDRVKEISKQEKKFDSIEKFINNDICFIAGSSWEADNDIFLKSILESGNLKTIIAPHNVIASDIENLEKKTQSLSVRYSRIDQDLDSSKKILIIDSIGSLKHLYKFADIAYIGGGMGDSGLHNILEAAVFAIPVIIGKNYKGFAEAEKLVKLGGVKSVNSKLEFDDIFNNLISDKTDRIKMGEINKKYIYSNSGGSKTIIKALTKSLN
ncbi:MAG TPA: glycosyltransferase N-terminal domain-containing protein [Flavobacteriaceae bacterium]|nr:glycosyltransferase N-terminal domain-containing protein [Flavobacteriaceae bacterium]HJO70950.1 glycosyltransferase N-terminal domain-containing protein [Flavobacteriaceae bacterium]